METNKTEIQSNEGKYRADFTPNRTGRVLSGLMIIAVGVVFFMKQSGVVFPYWLFTWPMFLIGIGMYLLLKSGFRRPGGLGLLLIGGLFLADQLIADISFGQFIWPAAIIFAGIWVMFSPGKKFGKERWRKHRERAQRFDRQRETMFSQQNAGMAGSTDQDSFMDSTVFFGSVKKNIYSKNFRGGEAVTIFGGTEINLSQAEINGTAELELTQIFGGTKLIIPAHWQVRSELVAIMGGVEDKRSLHPVHQEDDKRVLIIRGTSIFGGIEIKSY